MPAPESSGGADWRVLGRRARRFEDETEIARYAVARMLPKEALHPRISNKVWSAFMRSEFDVAVFQAMKAVEVAVREASGLPNDLLGVKLMRKAFDPRDGPLTDMEAEEGEKDARSALFAGAIGSYKNPHSHRDALLTDPAEAASPTTSFASLMPGRRRSYEAARSASRPMKRETRAGGSFSALTVSLVTQRRRLGESHLRRIHAK